MTTDEFSMPDNVREHTGSDHMSQSELLYDYSILGELVYIADVETYEMLYANDMVKSLIGGPYEGRKCYEAIMKADAPCSFCTNHLLSRDSYYSWTRYNETLHGYYALKDRLIDWNGRTARLEIAFDMSEHRDQVLNLEAELDLERLLVRCVKELRDIEGFSGDMSSVLRMIGETMGADRAHIFQVSADGMTFSNSHEWCAPGVVPEIDELQDMGIEFVQEWMPMFLHRETIVVEDLEELRKTSPKEYEMLAPQGISCLVNAPLLAEGKLIGSIGVDNPKAVDVKRTKEFFDSLAYFLSMELEGYRTKERLRVMSYTDSLTGLANRNRFIADTQTLDEEGPRSGFGVAYIDLNGLKEVNDDLGHAQGDRSLVTVAETLKEVFPDSSVYRLGGDEFLVVALDVDESAFRGKADYAKNKLKELAPIAIGIYYASQPCTINRAVGYADKTMYLEKRAYYEKQPAANRRRAER